MSLSAKPRQDGRITPWVIPGERPPQSYRRLPPRRTLIMGNQRLLQPLQRNQNPPLLLPLRRHQIYKPPHLPRTVLVLYLLQTSMPIFRLTTLPAPRMEPPLSPGATVCPLWRNHGQMVANFSIPGANLVVCIYRWRWPWFFDASVQRTSLLVPEMGMVSHKPSNPGPMNLVRHIAHPTDSTQGLM